MARFRGNSTNRKKYFSATNSLILINVVVFFAFISLQIASAFRGDSLQGFLESWIVLNPSLFFKGRIWTLLTSMFMHGGFTHLFVNMISLFFIGSFVEKLIGRKRFIWFYLISGLVAGLFFVVLAYFGSAFPFTYRFFGDLSTSAVGASGAIFGLGGLLALLLPRLPVLVFFILPMPLWVAMVFLLFGLWVVSAAFGLPIGNTAHLGGLVVGVLYGWYLRTKYSKKVEMLGRMFRQ